MTLLPLDPSVPSGRRPSLTLAHCWPLLPLLQVGCADWPRFAHLPDGGDPNALVAGADPGLGAEVAWSAPVVETESGTDNGLPIDAISDLVAGEGLLLTGTLDGTGWLSGSAPDRTAACGGSLAFPNSQDGSYAGDVDWASVQILGEGYLCATLVLDRESLRTDLVPYLLDDCDEPTTLLTDSDGQPWGYGLEGTTLTWAMPVNLNDAVGVALASYWPQDTTLQVGWTLGLSLSATGVCPALPETL